MRLQILIPQYKETDEVIKPEEWKDIEGYEGLYKISSHGRVLSIKREKTNGGIIRQSRSGSGYLQVHLSKNGVVKTFQTHRLVAAHFLGNENNLPEVNHKDEDKTNNCSWNLEYCTRKYNQNYGTAIQRAVKSHDYKASAIKSARNHDYKEVGRKQAKPVIQFSLDGDFIKRWDSIREIERSTSMCCGNISSACNGKLKAAYGYIWKFEGDM